MVAAVMRAAVHRRFGGPDVLTVVEVPRPVPSADQALVRVLAADLGAADVAARSGTPWAARLAFGPVRPRQPVLGGDIVGEVVELGPQATGFAVEDRVVGTTGARMGAHAEYVLISTAGVLERLPEGMDPVSAVGLVDGTAASFLHEHARLRPGERVLVNGASGAVGSMGVQLAAHLGAVVVGTSSERHRGLVAALGADVALDHGDRAAVRAAGPYDVVFDAYGRLGYRAARPMLTPRGRYLTTVPSITILLQAMATRVVGRRRAGIAFAGLRPDDRKLRDLRAQLALAQQGRLRSHVDGVYPLDRVAEAHRHVERGKSGHVVLTPAG